MCEKQNNSTKRHFQTFRLLSTLFFLYGLNIGDVRKNGLKKSRRSIYLFRTILLIAFANHLCTFFYIDIRLERPSFMIQFARKIVEFSTIILWYYLLVNCNNLFLLSKRFCQSLQEFVASSSTRAAVICAIWIFLVQVTLPLSFLQTTSEDNYTLYLKYYTLGLIWKDHSTNYVLLWIMSSAYYFYVYTFHACVSAFYIYFCVLGHDILKKHLKEIENRHKYKIFLIVAYRRCMIHKYDEILKTLQNLEDVMGFATFILQLQNLCCMFNLLVQVGAMQGNYSTKLARDKMIFAGIYATISFFATSIFAVRVHEIDKKIRKNKTRSQEGHNTKLNDHTANCCSQRAFVLTGWGFFNFDKKFVLSAVGNLITYTLLIVQFVAE